MSHPENASRVAPPATVYCDGELMPASSARLPIDDAGLLFGVGFFETFRTSGGRPHHWRFHSTRLTQASRVAGIEIPPTFLCWDETRLRGAVAVLLRDNGVSEAVFRYTLTAGRPSAEKGKATFTRP